MNKEPTPKEISSQARLTLEDALAIMWLYGDEKPEELTSEQLRAIEAARYIIVDDARFAVKRVTESYRVLTGWYE